jgi:hypothetical protein
MPNTSGVDDAVPVKRHERFSRRPLLEIDVARSEHAPHLLRVARCPERAPFRGAPACLSNLRIPLPRSATSAGRRPTDRRSQRVVGIAEDAAGMVELLARR